MKNIFIPIASSLLYQMIIENKECFYIYSQCHVQSFNLLHDIQIWHIFFYAKHFFLLFYFDIYYYFFFQYLSRVMILLIYRWYLTQLPTFH